MPDPAAARLPRRQRVAAQPLADLELHRQPARPGLQGGRDLTFDGTGSRDPDGTIGDSVWSDGDPPHPIACTPNPCPDATLTTAVTRLDGNPAGEIDEWSRQRDRMRVEYRFDHGGAGPGAQNVGLEWSTTWK